MLEQEIASIIKFVLDTTGNPSPYYFDVPEDFTIPAAYFPSPEISTRGDTFSSYALEYAWYIKFTHRTSEDAYALALAALTAIKSRRNLIPLINMDGSVSGTKIRIDDPAVSYTTQGQTVRSLGDSILKVFWTSRRPYTADEVLKMQDYHIEGWENPDLYFQRTIESAYSAAVERCINDFPYVETAGTYPPQS